MDFNSALLTIHVFHDLLENFEKMFSKALYDVVKWIQQGGNGQKCSKSLT